MFLLVKWKFNGNKKVTFLVYFKSKKKPCSTKKVHASLNFTNQHLFFVPFWNFFHVTTTYYSDRVVQTMDFNPLNNVSDDSGWTKCFSRKNGWWATKVKHFFLSLCFNIYLKKKINEMFLNAEFVHRRQKAFFYWLVQAAMTKEMFFKTINSSFLGECSKALKMKKTMT